MAYFTASCDDEETNRRFAEELELDYPILSDPGRKAAREYGLVENDNQFPKRWTFYIGKDGTILHVDKNVSARTHGEDLVKKLQELKVARKG